MKTHWSAIREHGVLAGRPLAADAGRRVRIAWDFKRRRATAGRFEVRIELDGRPRKGAWFDIEAPFEIEPPPSSDAALLLGAFNALEHGGELHVEGTISARLVQGLYALQAIWLRARPGRYRPFAITADAIVEELPIATSDQAIMPFTGGLDSTLTLCRHTDPERPLGAATRDLGATVFMPGWSPSWKHPESFEAAIGAVRERSEQRGVPLVVAATNFVQGLGTTADGHGTIMAGLLTFFSARFREGLIASSVTHASPVIRHYGSHPGFTPLASSAGFEVREDAGGLQRWEKSRALERYPEARDRIIVCWFAEGMSRNCCRCHKCTRTMTQMIAVGSSIEGAFPLGVDLRWVRKHLTNPLRQLYTERILEVARILGHEHPALRLLRRRLWDKRLRRRVRTAPRRLWEALR